MQAAADKSAQEEIFASMKRATLERTVPEERNARTVPEVETTRTVPVQDGAGDEGLEVAYPQLEVKPFNLTLEREIVHDENISNPPTHFVCILFSIILYSYARRKYQQNHDLGHQNGKHYI